jgi:type IV secretion system protein VirB11
MNAPLRNVYLESYLAPLAEWLGQADVTDIYVNRPGEIWLETLSEGPRRIEVPELTREVLARLVRQIASVTSQGINREHPLLAASLPGGERVQAVIAPATRGETALAIRKHVSVGLSLDDYRTSGATSKTAMIESSKLPKRGVQLTKGADTVETLRQAVLDRRNILVSGGTSSGKTTFINALLREIPPDERLIVIEDTPELQLVHANSIGLIAARGSLGEAEVSAEDLLTASLRMRPDRIILGEIRGSEAVTFLRTVNTGHPGSMSTIHADSPQRAIDQLALLVLQAGTQMHWDDVVQYVRNSLDFIVQLHRTGGKREVASVLIMD